MIDDDDPEGATPLSPDEKEGPKAKHIRTRGELDELEQTNITLGVIKLRKKNGRIDSGDALNVSFACDLHKDMFGRVWTWAGETLNVDGDIRRRYIEALRSADGGDYAPLFDLYTPQK